MRKNWVGWTQGVVVVLIIALVASFFVLGMAGGPAGGGSADVPQEPAVQTPPPVEPETAQPGVPTVPVAEHAVWESDAPLNPDRQLDAGTGSRANPLPESLGEDLSAYWEQLVEWEPCDGELCATILTPLDWENPGTASLEIAMRKVSSADPTRGSLFVNPGGPGFGGQDFATSFAPDTYEGYDIIGWDPRGTGESTTVECGTTEQTDAVFELDGSPDDDAELEALKTGWAEFALQCRENSGALLDHLTTVENVRDLDLLRHLLGNEVLNFLGVSYGTYVGAVYAELFPDRAGRLVLDSAVDITDDEEAASQAEGFELALRNYATWCADSDQCTLGDSADEVVDRIASFLAGLDAEPIEVGDRMLTQSLATTGVALFLYSNEEAYPALTSVVSAAMDGRGSDLLSASDNLNGRGNNEWETIAYAFPATRCVDGSDQGIDESYDWWQENKDESPVFGTNMGVDFVCETWTAGSAPWLKLTGEGAPPVLVVGTTGDSATPYEHAVSMAEQLESGVLLTLDGAGHGAVTGDNECINDAVSTYLEEGVAPEDGTTCS